MSYTLRPARGARGGWQYSIIFTWPEGGAFREKRNAPPKGKDAARRWVEARERALLAAGKAAYEAERAGPALVEIPTLSEFWPRVVAGHYRAERKKASTVDSAETAFRVHLAAPLGAKRIDKIAAADIVALKAKLADRSPKTANNILSVLSRALRCAVEWDVIPTMPCKIGLLKVTEKAMPWYELDVYRRFVDAAWSLEARALVLLAGSAGLRRGEILALRWSHVDLAREQLRIETNLWRKIEDAPKGWRGRDIPMTAELAACLTDLKAERGDDATASRHVLPGFSPRKVRNWMARLERGAGIATGTAREAREEGGKIHVLRHTFCSHLALAGAPAKAIQELAGHADLATTQRYMHLSPANRSAAIEALSALQGNRG